VTPDNGVIRATVHLDGPLDVAGSLEPFRRSGDDLLDRWDGTTLLRTLPTSAGTVPYRVRPGGALDAPLLDVAVIDPAHLSFVLAAVGSTFVTAPRALAELAAVDPVVARLDALYPGLRPVRQFDLFAAIVRCISAQQVNLTWAATLRRRLAESFGRRHDVDGAEVWSLDAATLAGTRVDDIRALQWTTRKAEYIVGVATATATGDLDPRRLLELPDDAVIGALTRLRGLGVWTAEWVLARSLGRPRVVAGDLGVRKAIGAAYLGDSLPSEERVRAATAHWGEAAGVAQALVLHSLVAGGLSAGGLSAGGLSAAGL